MVRVCAVVSFFWQRENVPLNNNNNKHNNNANNNPATNNRNHDHNPNPNNNNLENTPAIGHAAILMAAGFEKFVEGDEASREGFWRLSPGDRDEKKLAAVSALLERAKRGPGFK